MTKAYIYAADIYCEDCGKKLREDTWVPMDADPDDESTYDSDDYPKGPHHIGESDIPEHCAGCGTLLENPLTPDGVSYVIQRIADHIADPKNGRPEVLGQWLSFYEEEINCAWTEDDTATLISAIQTRLELEIEADGEEAIT